MALLIGSLVAILWLCVFVSWYLKRADRRGGMMMHDYIEAERAANGARRRAIDTSLFYSADEAFLASLPETGAEREREKVFKHAQLTMIRFVGRVRNVDLKKAFGPSQLEVIAAYDENFQNYLGALVDWAEALAQNGQYDDALRILNHTITLGSEYRKSFTLTADLYAKYAKTEASDKLRELLETARQHVFMDEGVKRRVIQHITRVISTRNEDDAT